MIRRIAALVVLALLIGCRHPGPIVAPHAVDAPVVWVDTADGAQIALQRHATPGGPPIVLCHGISSNHHFWDLAPGRSLALDLQARGYDVWNLDLRGHGFAERLQSGRRQRGPWTIDDYGRHDLPAAFAHIQEVTGAERLAYVGHSMGGMVLALYLAGEPAPPLSSAVVVASPLDFTDPDRVTRLMLGNTWLARLLPSLDTPTGAALLAGYDDHAPLRLNRMLYNPENISDKADRRLLMRRVASPLYRGEARQFALSTHDGAFRAMDGTVVADALGEVTVPMLFFAGRADRVANPDRVRVYYEAVGSEEKALVIASVANGFAGDYGHLDFAAGDDAPVDIFARIAAWVTRWR